MFPALLLSPLLLFSSIVFATATAIAAASPAPPSPLLHLTSSIAASPSVRLSPQPSIPFQLERPPASTPVLSVDGSQRFQSLLLGFGGAFTQAAGSQFARLPPGLQAELVRAYFHPTQGHAYNIGRVPINSCDYAQFTYSYDDHPDDFSLTQFDRTAAVDSASIIPLIQAAQAQIAAEGGEALMLYAAPWSPPAWMKASGRMNGSTDPGLKADPRVHRAWAQYFVEWLTVYQKRNISFWGLRSHHQQRIGLSARLSVLREAGPLTAVARGSTALGVCCALLRCCAVVQSAERATEQSAMGGLHLLSAESVGLLPRLPTARPQRGLPRHQSHGVGLQ